MRCEELVEFREWATVSPLKLRARLSEENPTTAGTEVHKVELQRVGLQTSPFQHHHEEEERNGDSNSGCDLRADVNVG
jgi:hypothetical protein